MHLTFIALVAVLLTCLHSCSSTESSLTDTDSGQDLPELSHRMIQSHTRKSSIPAIITFPDERNISKRGKLHPIPLKLIRDLNNEDDVLKIFENFVANVKVDKVNGQKFVQDLNNNPIPISVGDSGKKPQKFGIFKFKNPIAEKGKGSPYSRGNEESKFTRTGNVLGNDRTSSATGEEKVSKFAACEPELKAVHVPILDELGIYATPRCVRIHQCGGCCGSSLLKCEASETKNITVEVQKLEYQPDIGKFNYKNTETIRMLAATKCRCGCKIKPRDCNEAQYHDHNECQCVCKNEQERQECHEDPLKHWNSTTCFCECRETKECNSGFTLNPSTCTCEVLEGIPSRNFPEHSEKRKRKRSHKRRHIKSDI